MGKKNKAIFDLNELDSPIPLDSQKSFIKKDKLRVFIIAEDSSFKEYFVKFPDSYVITIKKRDYVVNPKAIIKGRFPTLIYFFNNPCPVLLEFQYSKISALHLRSDSQVKDMLDRDKVILANTWIDSESLNLAFNSRVLKGLYSGSWLTTKNLIIILVVVFIMVLIFLHLFGVIDFFALLGVKH